MQLKRFAKHRTPNTIGIDSISSVVTGSRPNHSSLSAAWPCLMGFSVHLQLHACMRFGLCHLWRGLDNFLCQFRLVSSIWLVWCDSSAPRVRDPTPSVKPVRFPYALPCLKLFWQKLLGQNLSSKFQLRSFSTLNFSL